MTLYLLVLAAADDGSWQSDPEHFDTEQAAVEARDHKTVTPGMTWVVYRCREVL